MPGQDPIADAHYRHVYHPGYVASERNRYGFGRMRLVGAIDEVLPPQDVDVWVRTADDDYGLEPYPGDCFWSAPDIRVFATGTANETTQIAWNGIYDVKVRVRNLGDNAAVGTVVRIKYALPHTVGQHLPKPGLALRTLAKLQGAFASRAHLWR